MRFSRFIDSAESLLFLLIGSARCSHFRLAPSFSLKSADQAQSPEDHGRI